MKICIKCQQIYELSEFRKNYNSVDGFTNKCKSCIKEKVTQTNLSKPKRLDEHVRFWKKEKKRLYYQEWVKNNKEQLKSYLAAYVRQNADILKIKNKEYRNKTKDIHKERKKEYQQKTKQRRIQYLKDNAEQIKASHRAYIANRKKSDPVFYFARHIRAYITKTFYRKKYKKDSKAHNLLGCDFEFLFNYLQMTYLGNYGEIYANDITVHIDHIIPLSSALSKDEVEKLNHYSNLQFLKAKDNLQKSNKLDFVLNSSSFDEDEANLNERED